MNRLLLAASYTAIAIASMPAWTETASAEQYQAGSTSGASDAGNAAGAEELLPEIIVTATRRAERLQDVPLSITAFQQEALTELGIVGYEGLAHETPGVIINKPTTNFNNFSARGVAINGYNANLQSTVAIYIDELPISANGNSTILDPNLFDVQRVEFLRGPQGTLFGSGSLAGALRIITKEPEFNEFDTSGLVDFGLTGSDSLRQRYNAMVNVPIVDDKLAFRATGFFRHEEGWVDNIGTGIDNSNKLVAWGGRAILLWQPTDRLSARFLFSHEDSQPEDSSLINPARDPERRTRKSNRPDLFQGQLTSYNATLKYEFDFAELTSSSTLSRWNQLFYVDLAATFGGGIPFGLDALAYDDIFVQETRMTSKSSGPLDWVLGGFYYYKRRDVDYNYRSDLAFLAARGMTGLDDEYYQRFGSHFVSNELAAFGEVTYHFGDKFWLTGGLRYGSTDVQGTTEAGGYTSNYLARALGGLTGPLTLTPVVYALGPKADANRLSHKISASFKPTEDITTYTTMSTGFRTPIVNARAGLASVVDPNDIIIPNGADSDKLTNYEIGAKGRFFDGRLSANIAAYWIDWSNIQVQANRVSDSVQFATNIGKAVSKGIEFEITAKPTDGLTIDLNGTINDTEVTKLTATEAAISGAVLGAQLAFPHFQGTARVRYDFALSASADGWVSTSVTHIGKFPGMFQNVPGKPTVVAPTYAWTESFENVGFSAGAVFGNYRVIAYIENMLDNNSFTYIHPEAFLDGRFGTLRPRTVGIRFGFGI